MSRGGGSGSGRKHNLSFTETVKFKDKNTKSVPSVPFHLTTFKTTLRNITSADELIFSGDAPVEEYSSETKKKLLTGSNDYVVSPTKDVRNIMSIEERTSKRSNVCRMPYWGKMARLSKRSTEKKLLP
jgi:hypothetical protein